MNTIDLKLYDYKKGWVTLSVTEKNENTKPLLERVEEFFNAIHDGSNFEISEVTDTYIRFGFYSPNTDTFSKMEVGVTPDGRYYNGSYDIYEKYMNRVDGVTFQEPAAWQELLESYKRTPSLFNYLVTVFYYDMTKMAAFEHLHFISFEDEDDPIEFFTADPNQVMPSTKEQIQARCLTLKRAIEIGSEEKIIGEDIYCNDTEHKEEIHTLREEDLAYLRKQLGLALKEAVNKRLNEL